MVLEARALEVLHPVLVAVLQPFGDLLGERVAELREVTIRLPVGAEAAAEVAEK